MIAAGCKFAPLNASLGAVSYDNPLNGPAPAAPSAPSDDPFGGPRVAAPQDLEYLMTPEPERSIGPGDVVGRTLHLLIARPLALLGLMVASGAVYATLMLVSGEMSGSLRSLLGGSPLHGVAEKLLAVVTAVVAWAASTVVQAPIVGAAIEARTGQRDLLGKFLQRGMRRLPSIGNAVGLIILISIAVLGGMAVGMIGLVKVAALVPGRYPPMLLTVGGAAVIFWFALRTLLAVSLAVPVVLVEGASGPQAVRRSWQLTAGHRYAIAFGIVLPIIAVIAIGVAVGMMAPQLAHWYGIGVYAFMVLYATAMGPATYVAFREFIDDVQPDKLL